MEIVRKIGIRDLEIFYRNWKHFLNEHNELIQKNQRYITDFITAIIKSYIALVSEFRKDPQTWLVKAEGHGFNEILNYYKKTDFL